MAGEIQLNSTSFASESGGTITINNATLASAVDLSNHYASTSDVQGIHTTSTVSSGSASLTINSFVSGSAVNDGDYVVGEGITPGTTVTAGGGTTSLTLSANAGATLSSDPVSFFKADKILSPGLVAGGLCRAWVNFDGGSGGSIRAAHNVSSVSGYNTGKYTINFTTAMPDNNYAVAVAVQRNYPTDGDTDILTANIRMSTSNDQLATSSVSVVSAFYSIGAYAAPIVVTVAIFR